MGRKVVMIRHGSWLWVYAGRNVIVRQVCFLTELGSWVVWRVLGEFCLFGFHELCGVRYNSLLRSGVGSGNRIGKWRAFRTRNERSFFEGLRKIDFCNSVIRLMLPL